MPSCWRCLPTKQLRLTTKVPYRNSYGSMISLLKKADPKHFFTTAAGGGERYRRLEAGTEGRPGLQERALGEVGAAGHPAHEMRRPVVNAPTEPFSSDAHPTLVEEEDAKDIEDRHTKLLNASRIRSSRGATIKQDGDERPSSLDGGKFFPATTGRTCAVATRRAACVNEIKRKELARQLTGIDPDQKIAVIPEEPG